MKKFLGIFDTRPLIWFHYIFLTIVLFFAFHMAYLTGLVQANYSQLDSTKWIILFIWYFLFISIGDQLIHYFLGVD